MRSSNSAHGGERYPNSPLMMSLFDQAVSRAQPRSRARRGASRARRRSRQRRRAYGVGGRLAAAGEGESGRPNLLFSRRYWRAQISVWCPGKDSNLHGLHRWYLKPVRLPIPPPGPGGVIRAAAGRCQWRGGTPAGDPSIPAPRGSCGSLQAPALLTTRQDFQRVRRQKLSLCPFFRLGGLSRPGKKLKAQRKEMKIRHKEMKI